MIINKRAKNTSTKKSFKLIFKMLPHRIYRIFYLSLCVNIVNLPSLPRRFSCILQLVRIELNIHKIKMFLELFLEELIFKKNKGIEGSKISLFSIHLVKLFLCIFRTLSRTRF